MAANPSGVKAEPIATNPLATARQLWALNRAGRLRLRSDDDAYGISGDPMSAKQADTALKALNSGLSPD